MKKIFLTVALALVAFCTLCAAACKKEEKDEYAGYTVTLSSQNVSLKAYEKHELTAVVRDAQNNEVQKAVIWQTANENIVKVTDGLIIATGAGDCEVSAVLTDGISAKCTVTVTDGGVIPELRLNTKSLSVGAGQTFTIVPRVYFKGSDCTEGDAVFTYKLLQSGIATVSNDGVVTASSAGETKITVYALWRGFGGPDKIGDDGIVAALTQTIDLKVIDV